MVTYVLMSLLSSCAQRLVPSPSSRLCPLTTHDSYLNKIDSASLSIRMIAFRIPGIRELLSLIGANSAHGIWDIKHEVQGPLLFLFFKYVNIV